MALVIGTNLGAGYNVIPAIYDRARHRYRDDYLHGPITLYMSAAPGLIRHKGTLLPNNPVPRRAGPSEGPVPGVPAGDVGLLRPPALALERQRVGGPGDSTPGPDPLPVQPEGPLAPPEEVVAYDWVVSRTDVAWSKHLMVQHPKAQDVVQSLSLDGPGTYTVRMRVFCTGNRYAEKTARFSVQEKFIVGLGDSWASGQGSPDKYADVNPDNPFGGGVCAATTLSYSQEVTPFVDESAIWTEPRAHRSFWSHHARAAGSFQQVFGETWNKESGPSHTTQFDFTKVVFASFARSGAKIRDGMLGPQDGDSDFIHAGQLEECRRAVKGRKIDALLISIGGNDAGFSGVLTDLVKEDSYYTLSVGWAGGTSVEVQTRLDHHLGVGLPAGQKGDIEVDLDTLRAAIDSLRQEVQIPVIFMSGYAEDLFFVGSGGQLRFQACDIFTTDSGLFSIDESEAVLIKTAAQRLNALIKTKTEEFGWHYVDVKDDFAGRGYCRRDDEQMWVRAEESCMGQGDWDGTAHPNPTAHLAMAVRYRDAMQQYL
jgi:hypothetical protein